MDLIKMEERVRKIKAELQKVGDMRPGSINTQMTVCGRKGCRCQDKTNPQKHGPYYQLSYVHQGKSSTQFIQKPLLPKVVRQLENYKTFKALTAEWVELSLAIAKEKLEIERTELKALKK